VLSNWASLLQACSVLPVTYDEFMDKLIQHYHLNKYPFSALTLLVRCKKGSNPEQISHQQSLT